MSYRAKLALFFLCGLAVLFVFDTAYQGLNTLRRLTVVEAERDQWQRPSDIIKALDLRTGNAVVDLGCGSGYFTLKLSSLVDATGKVIAEDIRKLPLFFLWFRTLGKSHRNVNIVLGDSRDPHLPEGGVDAVLIANTFHEFQDSHAILVHLSRALRSGGRLVVVDRGLEPSALATSDAPIVGHEISSQQVESDLRGAGFEIVSRQDNFIEKDPFNDTWWLIVARKP